MFTAIAIHANQFHRQVVYSLAVESHILSLARITDDYPTAAEFVRLTGLPSIDVVLLDLHDPERFLACLQELQSRYPDTPVVAFGGNPVQYRSLALAGVRHVLPFPMDQVSFTAVISAAIRESNSKPYPHLAVFLPAKAGCGASTAILASATALAALPGHKVLCMDADLRSGCLHLALGLAPRGCTQGVLAGAHELDRFRWDPAITHGFGVDFLFSSGESPNPLPEWSHYFALLNFAAERYHHLLIDLPELVNPATEEILRRAGAVYVVLTEEALSVRLAERRIVDLLKFGVPDNRIQLLLNRSSRNSAAAQAIQSALGHPVAFRFPNNYPAIQQALTHSEWPLNPRSDVGKAFAQFAQFLARPSASAAAAHAPASPKHSAGLSGLFRSWVPSR
jgi:cellulose biosynthesis protein BcsQ